MVVPCVCTYRQTMLIVMLLSRLRTSQEIWLHSGMQPNVINHYLFSSIIHKILIFRFQYLLLMHNWLEFLHQNYYFQFNIEYFNHRLKLLNISTDPSNDRQWLNDFKSRICLTHTKMLLHGDGGGGKREESDAGKIFFGVKYFCGFTKLHSLLSAIKRCETITFRFRYIARHCISDSFCAG